MNYLQTLAVLTANAYLVAALDDIRTTVYEPIVISMKDIPFPEYTARVVLRREEEWRAKNNRRMRLK